MYTWIVAQHAVLRIACLAPQVSDPDKIDAIFVPVGGGGLIAGIAAFTKALKPNIKVRERGVRQ